MRARWRDDFPIVDGSRVVVARAPPIVCLLGRGIAPYEQLHLFRPRFANEASALARDSCSRIESEINVETK